MVSMGTLRHESGFTLISVLIGTIVLSIGLLGAARMVVIVFNSNTFSQHLTTATTLAQEKIAVVQRLGYANADTGRPISRRKCLYVSPQSVWFHPRRTVDCPGSHRDRPRCGRHYLSCPTVVVCAARTRHRHDARHESRDGDGDAGRQNGGL